MARAQGVERPVEVDRDDPIPLVGREIGELGHDILARAEDQRVEPAGFAPDRRERLADRPGIGQIEAARPGPPPRRADRPGGRVRPGLVAPVADDDIGPLLGEEFARSPRRSRSTPP